MAAPPVPRRFAGIATRLFLDDAQAFVRAEIAAQAPVLRASAAPPD